jgi:hypothetical protein
LAELEKKLNAARAANNTAAVKELEEAYDSLYSSVNDS